MVTRVLLYKASSQGGKRSRPQGGQTLDYQENRASSTLGVPEYLRLSSQCRTALYGGSVFGAPDGAIYTRKHISQTLSTFREHINRHAIRSRHGFGNPADKYPISIQAFPANLWDEQNRLFLTKGLSSFAGLLFPRSAFASWSVEYQTTHRPGRHSWTRRMRQIRSPS